MACYDAVVYAEGEGLVSSKLPAGIHNRAASTAPSGVAEVRDRLRSLILTGGVPADAVLSQVELANRLGVSRTPLREAMRMLQEEGLVQLDAKNRYRTSPFDPVELDNLYSRRILLEALAASMTMRGVKPADIARLKTVLEAMETAANKQDLGDWSTSHREFHEGLVAGTEPDLRSTLASYGDRALRYRSKFLTYSPIDWASRTLTHQQILNAFESGDVSLTTELLARHQARTSLHILAEMAPTFQPFAVPTAMQLLLGPRASSGW